RNMLAKDSRLRPTAAEVEARLSEKPGPELNLSVGRLRADKPITVGRVRERAALNAAFASAAGGRGSLVYVSGGPGMGKTTLVEDFITSLAPAHGRCLVARGHCSERLAGTEAYLPLIDALGDLLRHEPTGSVARLMKVVSPTWYAQVGPSAREPGG